MWWLTRCCRYPFMGITFLLGKTFPSCSLLSVKACKEELLIMTRMNSQDCDQAFKKSKVINSCAGSVLQNLE